MTNPVETIRGAVFFNNIDASCEYMLTDPVPNTSEQKCLPTSNLDNPTTAEQPPLIKQITSPSKYSANVMAHVQV